MTVVGSCSSWYFEPSLLVLVVVEVVAVEVAAVEPMLRRLVGTNHPVEWES